MITKILITKNDYKNPKTATATENNETISGK